MRILIVVLFMLTSWMTPTSEDDYLIICSKEITVQGNTTIGSFSCQYSVSEQNDTLFLSNKIKKRKTDQSYAFYLKVPQFKCGNFLLNGDFQKTLRAEQYPQIIVEVTNLCLINKCAYVGSIDLKLVGKTKTINDIQFIERLINGQRVLSTKFEFTSTEFNLAPPKRLGGLIEASDCMEISVDLSLN